MARDSGASTRKTSSVLNFLALVAICILVIIFLLRILYHFVPSLDFIGQINVALSIIQNALLAIVVFFSGINMLAVNNFGSTMKMGIGSVLCIILAVISLLFAPITRYFLDENASLKKVAFEGVRACIGIGFIFISLFCLNSFFKVEYSNSSKSIYSINNRIFYYYINNGVSADVSTILKLSFSAAAGYMSLFIPLFLPVLVPMASMPTRRDKIKQREHNSNKSLFGRCFSNTIGIVVLTVVTFIAVSGIDKITIGVGGWLTYIALILATGLCLAMLIFGKDTSEEQS